MLEIEYGKEIHKLQVQIRDLQAQINSLAKSNAEIDSRIDLELHNFIVENEKKKNKK